MRHVIRSLVPMLLLACGSSSSSNGKSTSMDHNSSSTTTADAGATVITATGPMGSPGALSVWTAGVGTKIQPTTAPGTSTSISVATARASWAAAQLVVHGQGGNVQGVTITSGDLSDGAGHTLAKSNVTFFLEYFIDFAGVKAIPGNSPVPANSKTMDTRLPDPLIPLVDPYTGANAGQPFFANPDENAPIWVDVHVPTGTTAGTYTGTISVAAQGGLTASVPISVTVWDIDLPDLGTVTTHFKMSINALIDYHAGISQCEGSDCYLDDNAQAHTIVKRYEELAHDHRIDSGQKFTPSPGDGCSAPTDWTAYDSSMAPYMDGSYFADGAPSSCFDVPLTPGENDDNCTEAQITAMASAWATHLKSKGWFDKAIAYALDEPESSMFASIAQDSASMQAGDPDWKARVMDTTSPTASKLTTLGASIGIYTVNLPEYDDWDGNSFYGRAEWPALMAQGTQLWFYESNSVTPPYPTFASNTTDGLEPVMAMWGSWYESATGFLYWDIAGWTVNDPWGPNIGFGMTGDGTLIYPGNHAGSLAPVGSPSNVAIDGPIPSYRLKMVRQGLQDWALFRLADTKGLTSTVRAQVATVYGQLGGCTYQGCPAPQNGSFFWKTDETAMNAIRAAVAKAIAP